MDEDTQHLKTEWIGMESIEDGGMKACDSETTTQQIEALQSEYDFNFEVDGETFQWPHIYNPDFEPEGQGYPILSSIVEDRKMRVDDETFMADRPPFAIFTIDTSKDEIVRIESYAGHGALSQVYDLGKDDYVGSNPTYEGQ